MTQDQMTNHIWDIYHPGNIWYVIAAIGLSTIIGLVIYDYVIKKQLKKAATN